MTTTDYYLLRVKLEKSLSANTGLTEFTELYRNSTDYELEGTHHYAPLVGVDVERSFSLYKYILSDRGTSMSEQNIEKLNMLMFNRAVDCPGRTPVIDL